MAYDLYQGSWFDNNAKTAYLVHLFQEARTRRLNHEVLWEENSSLFLPDWRASFSFGHLRAPGAKYQQFMVDSTGQIALWRFMAICDALLTPHNMLWSVIRPVYRGGSRKGQLHKDLMKDRAARVYFEQVTNCLWNHRYRPESGFMAQQQQNYMCLGVFGNQCMFVDEFDARPNSPIPGLRYMGLDPGQVYLLRDHQGLVTGIIRSYKLNAQQAWQKFPDKVPPQLFAALETNSATLFDFLTFILPRTNHYPGLMLDDMSKPWYACDMSVTGYTIVKEGGYTSFPMACGGYIQAPEEDYCRGPADLVRAEGKTLNAEKSDYLTQGHRAASPTYLVPDGGLIDFKAHPNAINVGGWSADGKPLVGILPVGNIQVSEKMLERSEAIINAAFLVDLFPLLFDTKGNQKSAREVIEAANEKGIFLAPTLGRQFGEYQSPLVNRELDILSRLQLLPPMPPSVREAKGEYQTVFTSPLARALRGQAVAGFMRTVEMANTVSQALGGDQEVFDRFDFDVAIPAISDEQYVPASWMASDDKVAAKRKARAQAQERETQTKELPGRAAIMKAQAITAKAQAGQNTGGTLSGTPEGGMPQMPGQQQPGGRQFGQPGQQEQQ